MQAIKAAMREAREQIVQLNPRQPVIEHHGWRFSIVVRLTSIYRLYSTACFCSHTRNNLEISSKSNTELYGEEDRIPSRFKC